MIWVLAVLVLLALIVSIALSVLAARKSVRVEAENPPIGQILDVGGREVHYTDQGTGPVVILLHGAGGNLRDWHYSLVPVLEKTHRVITFDRPGHGYTPALHSDGETLIEQSALLNAAAAELDIESALVVGYSFGGAVSLRWAIDRPDFVKGLVLVSAVSNPWKGPVDGLYRYMAAPVIGWIGANALGSIVSKERIYEGYRGVFTPQKTPEGFLDFVAPELSTRPASFRTNARQVSTVKPQIIEQSELYDTLELPIEIIHGDADTSVPIAIHAEVLHEKAPNTRLTRLEGMGHGAHILAQSEILDAIKTLSK